MPAGVLVAPVPNVLAGCGGVGTDRGSRRQRRNLPPDAPVPQANGSCTLTVNVTAAAAGIYVNTLLAGALVTAMTA